MANLARHASLRFSVFEVAADLGLETHVLDGNFNPIIEEDEDESPTSAPKPQRRTQSSDELTDSPYPLTPPSSNDALLTTRPLLLNKKIEEKPKFIENFSSTSVPLNATPQRPTTPRSGSGKLRKMQPPPPASSPPLELHLDFGTDIDIIRRSREQKRSLPEEQKLREKSPAIGKKSKDRSQHGHESSTQRSSPMPTPDEEEKGLLGGLLRFRTRSKERKAAAKQALQQVAEPYRSMSPPIRSNSTPPPPLPIALRFARQQQEALSFRPPKAPESESSHGGTTSVGHADTSIGHQSVTAQGSSEAPYPRPRDRSSRYERPHPVWRNGPSSTIGKNATVPLGEAAALVPQERHAYPPNQTIFDREPVKPSRVPINGAPSAPTIDMEAVNKYYGITPVASNTPVANIPATPSPQSRFALTQALSSQELKVPENPATPRMTPTTMAPASPSPYIVPSPAPTQEEFAVRKREKPGRMNRPPALDPALVASRRKMAMAHIPPPSPPPTTELPPIPTDFPPPASSLRPPIPSPLATARSPSPNMRMGSTGLLPPPPPYSERSATATPEVGVRSASPMYRPVSPPNPPRAASPIQRGKTPAFPMRPITPTTRPITPNREPQPQAQVKQTSPVATRSNQPFLLNRRPDFGASDFARPRRSSLNEQDLAPLRGNLLAEDTPQPVAIPRKRSVRRGNRQSGYDSDDAESRYSRDTYYGRDTAYFDDQNMPPLPGEPMPELPRNFGNLEQERKAGRERLLKFLANRDA